MDITNYVCGLAFNLNRSYVLLVEKKRPIWHAGLLNGIGGKINRDEKPVKAMQRTFAAQTGVSDDMRWEEFAVVSGIDAPGGVYTVHFFSAFSDRVLKAHTVKDETIVYRSAHELYRQPVVPDLRFLIPLALDMTSIVKPVVITREEG